MWLFLASDAMLMASLLSGYVLLRASATTVPALPWSGFGLMIEGGLLLGATGALRSDKRYLLLLGSVLAFTCASWQTAALAGTSMRPASHVLVASWFTLTAAHAVHVAAGAAAIAWIAVHSGRGDAPRVAARLHAIRLYWYFIVTTWVVIVVAFGV
jgi:cytochrome c oxidase subunit 3